MQYPFIPDVSIVLLDMIRIGMTRKIAKNALDTSQRHRQTGNMILQQRRERYEG